MRTKTRPAITSSLRRRLPPPAALLFALAVAAVGGYLIIQSRAATLPNDADYNDDQVVNLADLSILLSNFNKPSTQYDLNDDGRVDLFDLSILLSNFNRTVTTPSPVPQPVHPLNTTSVRATFYGSYDNDPPGSLNIAHPVLHQQAGGTGTYADPLTFASPAGNGAYKWGQIIYVPFVQKYFIREDECAVSWTAPEGCGAVTMTDLYIGNPSSDKAVLNCEGRLTPDGNSTIILDPPANLTVDPKPLWNQATGECGTIHTSPY